MGLVGLVIGLLAVPALAVRIDVVPAFAASGELDSTFAAGVVALPLAAESADQ